MSTMTIDQAFTESTSRCVLWFKAGFAGSKVRRNCDPYAVRHHVRHSFLVRRLTGLNEAHLKMALAGFAPASEESPSPAVSSISRVFLPLRKANTRLSDRHVARIRDFLFHKTGLLPNRSRHFLNDPNSSALTGHLNVRPLYALFFVGLSRRSHNSRHVSHSSTESVVCRLMLPAVVSLQITTQQTSHPRLDRG